MRLCPPPYRPLRGAEPPHFVDRGSDDDMGAAGVVASALDAYRNGPCDPRFHRLVSGGQAMGKTAVLRAVCREAEARLGWAVVFHRCKPKERAMTALVSEVDASVKRRWAGLPSGDGHAGSGDDARAGRGEPGGGLPEGAAWQRLKTSLQRHGQFGAAASRGLLIALDDAELLGAGEAEAFGYLARALAGEDLPVALLISGSPCLAGSFARSGNFSGRVWQSRLRPFEECETREAIVVPAAERGVEFQQAALAVACAAAAGSPLEVQRVGFVSWVAAGGRRRVGVAEVEAALAAPGLGGPAERVPVTLPA